MPCPGPKDPKRPLFGPFLLNFPDQAQTGRSRPILADFSIESGPKSRRSPETAQRVFFGFYGSKTPKSKAVCIYPENEKSWFWRGPTSAVETFQEFKFVLSTSLFGFCFWRKFQPKRTKQRWNTDPPKSGFWGFQRFRSKSAFLDLSPQTNTWPFSRPLRASKPLPIDLKHETDPGAHFLSDFGKK